jgi:hypothetical protein
MIPEFQNDPILQKWIQPQYLAPQSLRDAVEAQPCIKYLVADDFFNTKPLDDLIQKHHQLAFQEDDIGLHYDSTAVRISSHDECSAELFFHKRWHEYCEYIVGAHLRKLGETLVKLRRHPEGAKGFWIHTDVSENESKAMTVLGYFNKGWSKQDGGLLQLWRTYTLNDNHAPVYRWKDYEDRRLSFLSKETRFSITAVAPVGLLPLEVELLEQIEPIYNRVVFCDFQRNPAFHSITPSNNRARNGLVQWLY